MTIQSLGYDWIYNTYQSVDQIKALTKEQKMESKMGFDAKFLLFLKSQTTEDVIILMPPSNKVKRKRDGGDFSNDSAFITNVSWASYFVFPRKLIYENVESAYKNRVTHVPTVNKWGYHYVPNIPADQQQEYSIIKLEP